MYNDLQDALGYRADQNAPFNPVYSLPLLPVSKFPIDTTAPVPAAAKLVPGGVQPNMKTPTLISWSLRAEHEISPNTTVTVGYVGSHGYHELIGVDANEPTPVICPAAPCPAVFPTWNPSKPTTATNSPNIGFPIGSPLAGAPVPAGTYYIPAGTPKANPAIANTWTWFSEGVSTYNALQVDLRRRFSHGLSLRGVYTFSKALDDGDSLNQTTANNAPGLVSNPFNLAADKGLATFDVRHIGVDQRALRTSRSAAAANSAAVSMADRQPHRRLVAFEHHHRAIGLPVHAAAQLQPRKYRATHAIRSPLSESRISPARSLPAIPHQWFNPAAFIAPPSTSGFAGNLGRDTYIGPGLATWDFSRPQRHEAARTPQPPVPRRTLQPARPRQLQHSEPDHLHAANRHQLTGVSGTAGAITSTTTQRAKSNSALSSSGRRSTVRGISGALAPRYRRHPADSKAVCHTASAHD